jgi:2-oxo-hept-3-ene-1,7-dioate hydratase
MITHDQAVKAGKDLYQAEVSRQQIGLLSRTYPGIDMDDAYAIQAELVKHKVAAGRRVTGWKIGLTSRAMQDALKIDMPDSGVLFDDMYFESGSTVRKGRFIQPRVEAEIAFVMKHDLTGDNLTEADILEATDYIQPVLEILDTRILRQDPETGAIRKVYDTIADNAANAGYVLGTERVKSDEIDMRWIGAIASRNGIVEETGLGAGVLNNPLTSMLWLAQRLASYGSKIEAGQVVLSGSFIRPIEAPSGSQIEADYGSFGHLSCNFS